MAAVVDTAWYHVVRPAWFEILPLPFADHNVLQRCRSESLLADQQFRLCSQYALERNRLVLVYLMTNGVRLAKFLEVLRASSNSKVGKKLGLELNKAMKTVGSSLEQERDGTQVTDSAKLKPSISAPRCGGGWHSEVIKQNAKQFEAMFAADPGQLILSLQTQVRFGGICDQLYADLSKQSIPAKAAKLYVSHLVKSELAAGLFLTSLVSGDPGLLLHVELSSGLVNITQTQLERLHMYMRLPQFLYIEEDWLSGEFLGVILPAIAPHWKNVAQKFKTLSDDEIKFLEKTHPDPFVQAQQMLQAAREQCRKQEMKFSLVYLVHAMQEAGLTKEVNDVQQAFNTSFQPFQRMAEALSDWQAKLAASQGNQQSASLEQAATGVEEQRQAFQQFVQALGLQTNFSLSLNGNNLQTTDASGQPMSEQLPWQVQFSHLQGLPQPTFQSSQAAPVQQVKLGLGRKSNIKTKGMSEETWQSYQEALKGGKRTVLHERVILCGAGRVGKTSFRRSLHNEQFQRVSDSTFGVELHKVVCTAKRDSDSNEWTWSEVKSVDEHQMLLTVKALTEEVTAKQHNKSGSKPPTSSGTAGEDMSKAASQLPTPTDETTQETAFVTMHTHHATPVTSSPQPQNSLSGPKMAEQFCSKPSSPATGGLSIDHILVAGFRKKISLQVRQVLENIRHNPEKLDLIKAADNLCFVDVWDFAGQEAFVVIQHMLLAELRCAYAAMFNSKLPLNQHSEQHICQDGEEHKIDSDPDATNFDMLESWLNVIQQVVGNNTDVPVYVVGSHADQLSDEQRSSIERYLWRNIQDKAYFHNVDDIVFVDNTLSGSDKVDPGVRKLRNQLIEKMLKQEAMQLPIPLSWLPFTLITRQLAKVMGLPWLTMDEVKLVADEVCDMSSPAEIRNLLQFHHALGQVLHYPDNPNLSDRAIINVEWLLRVVSRLFIPQPPEKQAKKFRAHYTLLHKRGILLESLAQHIWEQDEDIVKHTEEPEHRRFLFHLMEEFSLLYDTDDVKSFDGLPPSCYFYVPALVTRVVDSQHTTKEDDVEESPPLFLYSGTSHLFPQSLFWCLVVRSMREYSPSKDPILHRSSAHIACFRAFRLVLQYFQHGIKIIVEHEKAAMACSTGGLSLQNVCQKVLPFIENQLNEVKGDTLKHFEWQRAARCPCSFNDNLCVKHTQANCSHVSCHHFVIFRDGETPCCSHPKGLQRAQDVSTTTNMWPCWDPQDFPSLLTLGSSSPDVVTSLAMMMSGVGASFTNVDKLRQVGFGEDDTSVEKDQSSSEQVVGVCFKSLSDVECTRIFTEIAKEFDAYRSAVIRLLLGHKANKKLELMRSSTAAGHSEEYLLFEGLYMWLEQSEEPTGQELYDAMITAGCPDVRKYRKPFELPPSYSGGVSIF